jgi:hypothetical protein
MFTKNVKSEVYEEHVDDFIIHCEVLHLTSEELDEIQYFDSGGVLMMSTSMYNTGTGCSASTGSACSTTLTSCGTTCMPSELSVLGTMETKISQPGFHYTKPIHEMNMFTEDVNATSKVIAYLGKG